jgi:hypothetical protein
MAYVPLNRVVTDKFTPGGEYVILATGLYYTGYYHEYYNSTLYTGNNPSYSNKQRLVRPNTDTPAPVNSTFVVSLETGTQFAKTGQTTYSNLDSYQPQLTDQDYTVGDFRRYFAKQINALSYTEISLAQYNDLRARTSKYLWQYYQTLSLPWVISGVEIEVAKANKNNTVLAEKLNNIKGLQQFLQEDYTKFYNK